MPSLLDVGNLFIFVSGFMMIRTAYRDRAVLRGYNLVGSLSLAVGITLVILFYAFEGYWVSVFLTLPNYGYWIVVVASLLRTR
ncbi:hypothetical protein JXL21_03730 [Candidatus Bathyarchaeota archaeon]|nr:hypothetical protein [Candidatus Bathyarchaeota archaeon]